MKCPHCLNAFFGVEEKKCIWKDILIDEKSDDWIIGYQYCPSCYKLIIRLFSASGRLQLSNGITAWKNEHTSCFVKPKTISRTPIPAEVPEEFSVDYKEACLVLADSPKASAALSRRCLQNLLRNKGNVKHQDLSKEIQETIDKKFFPSHISEALDAVRHIGNFAAHPIKSTSSGEIVDVEPQEAEWSLDVLELLFDFYFVLPAKHKIKKDALNEKLKDIGKPNMK